MAQNQDLLDIAQRAAERGAAFIREATRPAPDGWGRKAASDFVTEIDRGAEAVIAEALRAAVPDSVVVGEELSPTASATGLRWIVDPVDGTTNYLHGFPVYAVSVAAVVDDVTEAGIVVDVARQLTYRARAGGGAWCGDERLRVSSVAEPAMALLATGFPFKRPAADRLDEYLAQFARLLPACSGIRRAGAAALDLAWLAAGTFDAFWELWLEPWDIAAGTLLVREAGGLVTDLDGTPVAHAAGPVVAGNPTMHAWLLKELGR